MRGAHCRGPHDIRRPFPLHLLLLLTALCNALAKTVTTRRVLAETHVSATSFCHGRYAGAEEEAIVPL